MQTEKEGKGRKRNGREDRKEKRQLGGHTPKASASESRRYERKSRAEARLYEHKSEKRTTENLVLGYADDSRFSAISSILVTEFQLRPVPGVFRIL